MTDASARPNVSSGALFTDTYGHILLVNPTYKPLWNLPGGAVDAGETPYQTCVREVREELGITPHIGKLLLLAWAQQSDKPHHMYFIFNGGTLNATQQAHLKLPPNELGDFAFLPVENIDATVLPAWLLPLVHAALKARDNDAPAYHEITKLNRQLMA